MESIREIFKIGMGPSSSHTMGPRRAAEQFKKQNPDAKSFRVILYGSLAATGRGHMTDLAITSVLGDKTEIVWKPEENLPLHPNGMRFFADANTTPWTVYSVGGGSIRDAEHFGETNREIYKLHSMKEILELCDAEGIALWEFVQDAEDDELWDYMRTVWNAMRDVVKRGLETEGALPGPLKIRRKAFSYFVKAQNSTEYLRRINELFSYALACSEENASAGMVVTAPTCGSCGIVPGVLNFMQLSYKFTDVMVWHALATAGLVGNLAKKNASISGAEVGCQGEVGVACAMAAAAATQLLGGSIHQIEYAAEMGLEHHLGLTCDPVMGLVQIPCIERNAMAASRALDCASFALLSDGRHRVSYDDVLATMARTGRDLNSKYRETSMGGLAKELEKKFTR